jgi:hypothetical protein
MGAVLGVLFATETCARGVLLGFVMLLGLKPNIHVTSNISPLCVFAYRVEGMHREPWILSLFLMTSYNTVGTSSPLCVFAYRR